MPKIRDSAYYDDAGGYRRAALDDKLAFFIQHPVWEGHPEYFMKNGSPKELYAISGMTIENMLRLAGMGQQAMNVTEGFNYLVEQRARGNVHFISGLYPESERKKDPEKEKTRGLLYQGKAGKPLAVVIADQLTKLWIVETIPENETGYSFLGGFIRIIHVRNDAVAFSLGASLDVPLKIVLFIILPLVLVSFLAYCILSEKRKGEFTVFEKWCLAGIIGGGAGNLIDRLFRSMRVVDWISVKMYGFLSMEYFPTWNIADASVVICVILLMLSLVFCHKRGR